jgi:acetyl-CoA acetyltransferase
MKSLKDRYCIVGVGETEYSRNSGRTTRAMAVEAIRKAMLDAGLTPGGIDGMMSYQSGDSTPANWVASDLGIRLNFYMDVFGGGSSTEALVGLAMGAIEAGMCNTVALFRSMNGYTEFRIGGTGTRAYCAGGPAARATTRRAGGAGLLLAVHRNAHRHDRDRHDHVADGEAGRFILGHGARRRA